MRAARHALHAMLRARLMSRLRCLRRSRRYFDRCHAMLYAISYVIADMLSLLADKYYFRRLFRLRYAAIFDALLI